MARARNIKPALFKNEVLGTADMGLTVLFAGLWTLADREGRLEDRPLRIKAEIFPYRDGLDINGYLTELERLEFIDRYEVDGVRIIQVLTFSEHQNPHKTEKASVLPERQAESPVESASQELTVKAPLNNDANTEAAVLIPDSLNTDSLVLIPDSGSSDSPAPAAPTAAADFLKHLTTTHGYDERSVRTKTQNIQQAKQWLADGVTLAELDDAVEMSRSRLDDDRDPPVKYLATVLASNRKKAEPVKAGSKAVNTHGGFSDPGRYAIDDTAKRFKIVGGDA